MSKDQDPLVLDAGRQKAFEFIGRDEYNVELVGLTPEGHGLYKKKEMHGGHSYWTDEYGTPFMVWDEGLGNLITLFAALNDLKIGELMWRHIGTVYGYTAETPTIDCKT